MSTTSNKINRLPATIEQTGLSKSTIYKLIKEGKFPKPLKLSKRSVGWRQSDLDNFLNSLEEV